MLSAAHPEATTDSLAALSIGKRDAALLLLRESLFGSMLNSIIECPHCHVAVEFVLNMADLHGPTAADPATRLSLSVDDILVRFRLLNSVDLIAIENCKDISIAREQLLHRCIIEATRSGESVELSELPRSVLDELVDGLSKADSQAEILLSMQCPECAGLWIGLLDIASFLWTEISLHAKRFLGAVHRLAWAYGWSESDILAMSNVRRQFYLSMVE